MTFPEVISWLYRLALVAQIAAGLMFILTVKPGKDCLDGPHKKAVRHVACWAVGGILLFGIYDLAMRWVFHSHVPAPVFGRVLFSPVYLVALTLYFHESWIPKTYKGSATEKVLNTLSGQILKK